MMHSRVGPADTGACARAAIDAMAAGISVWPPRQDHTKAPDGAWKIGQTTRATEQQVIAWYGSGRTGVGWITGAVSGGIEVLDFDDRSTWVEFRRMCADAGAGELLDRVVAGYLEHTPNGAHLIYRCSVVEGNQKLAKRKADGRATIETRGEGGYIIVAPSHGSVNARGAYTLISGSPSSIVTITPEERAILLDMAKVFDESEQPPANVFRAPRLPSSAIRPGDEFNDRATWEEVLTPHGWAPVFTRMGTTCWRRPGKNWGISATTNHGGSGLLYVFSSSTTFDANRGYSKFSAYALLNHAGNFRAAASDLSLRGFGVDAPPDSDVDLSGIMAQGVRNDTAAAVSIDDLLRVPGLVGELAKWINDTSPKQQPRLALGASIAAVGAIIGRKARLPSGLRSNVYVLGIAESGTGKERAREAIRQVFDACGAGEIAAYDAIASDSAINTAISATPACLFLVDEAGREFSQMFSPNAPGHIASIVSVLLKLYGASASKYYGKSYADRDRRVCVDQPCLCLYGTTVPRNLYAAMSPEQVHDGFLSRFLLFESDDHDPPFRDVPWQAPPDRLVAGFRAWNELVPARPDGGNLTSLAPSPHVVQISADAGAVFDALEASMRSKRADARKGGDEPGIYMRVGTSARKLAMIRACGITHEHPEITETDAAWGAQMAVALVASLVGRVDECAAEGRYEANLKRVLGAIRRSGKRGMGRNEISRRTQWLDMRAREDILRHLLESGQIVAAEDDDTGGRPRTVYRAAR